MECSVRAYTGSDPFLFISYSHNDAALVYPIIERLVMDGYRVWYDDGIHAGEDWTETVADRLEASSMCLAMLTENYVSSINCRNELAYSLSMSKRLIGIKLKDFDIPKGIRLQLGNNLYLEKYRYSETEFFDRFSMSHGVAACRVPETRITDGQLTDWRTKWTKSASNVPEERQAEAFPSGKTEKEGKHRGKPFLWIAIAAAAGFLVLGTPLFSHKGKKQTGQTSPALSEATDQNATELHSPALEPIASPTDAQETTALPTKTPDEAVQASSSLSRDWAELMDLPSAEEIASRNQSGGDCAPFVAGSFSTGDTTYSGVSVDFKADQMPAGTYCAVSHFNFTYPTLSQYPDLHTSQYGYAGFAGFQRLEDGSYVVLMSIWDEIYTADGQEQRIRARLIEPEPDGETAFSNQGTGVKYQPIFPWKEGLWYQAMIYLGTSKETGNTTLEYWVQNLETEQWFQVCTYDLGAPSVGFKGDLVFSLSNNFPQTAGEIRTMEIRNARILSNEWVTLTSGTLRQYYDHKGSYCAGAEGDTVYLLTTGVENKAGASQETTLFTVQPKS